MKNQKGITLIALVITIIVLLILAGISIAALSGDNGLLKTAKNAETESQKGNLEEAVKLAIAENYMNSAHPGNFILRELTVEKIVSQNDQLTTANVSIDKTIPEGNTLDENTTSVTFKYGKNTVTVTDEAKVSTSTESE